MNHNGKLNNFLKVLSYHSMCQLGINYLLTTRCKCFPILGMLTNLGVQPILFFHIRPHIPHNVLMTYMLTKRISLLFFPSTSNLAFDNVQGSIFAYKQFFPWKFCSPFFLKFSCCIIVFLLDAYLGLDGLIIFSTWGRPTQRHGYIFNVICI